MDKLNAKFANMRVPPEHQEAVNAAFRHMDATYEAAMANLGYKPPSEEAAAIALEARIKLMENHIDALKAFRKLVAETVPSYVTTQTFKSFDAEIETVTVFAKMINIIKDF
jgi:hypothetical protein